MNIQPTHIAEVIAPMFSRGSLPERVALMVANEKHRLRVGTVLTWSEQRRAYQVDGRDLLVRAEYVRHRWLTEFCWAPPIQMELIAS